MHFQPSTGPTSCFTVNSPAEKTEKIETKPSESYSSMVSKEIEELGLEILASGLFSFEQTLAIDEWKEEFFAKHVHQISKSEQGRYNASLAMFYFYKKFLLPCLTQSLCLTDQKRIDGITCRFKVILALALPVGEQVESFLEQNLSYSDEMDVSKIEYERKMFLAIATIYDEQTELLLKEANQNREIMDREYISLQEGIASLCDAKLNLSQPVFKKLTELTSELDKHLQDSVKQDERLKMQAEELNKLQHQKMYLLNQFDNILK